MNTLIIRRNPVPVVCGACQEPFVAERKAVKRGHGRFCSRACRARGNVNDVTGQTFGRLYVEEFVGMRFVAGKPRATFLCRCTCGNRLDVMGLSLVTDNTTSCGCYALEMKAKRATRHGGSRTREYGVWLSMKARCLTPGSPGYCYYGARGIGVCERWQGPQGFTNFISDLGRRPSPAHTLERKDNEKGYGPDNCEWATHAQQQRNRRTTRLLTLDGETLCLTDWAARAGISAGALHNRLQAGASLAEAISRPARGSQNRRP